MVQKVKQRTLLPNQVPTQGTAVTPTTANGVAGTTLPANVRRQVLKLTDTLIPVTAALDYGGLKLCDLPNSNLVFLGAIVDLSAAVTGTGATLAAVDFALGTVTTASTTFSNAGEDNLVEKIDCTAGGAIDGASVQATTSIFVAAGASNAIYANVATGNITTDGGVTLNGTIELFFLDLGKAS